MPLTLSLWNHKFFDFEKLRKAYSQLYQGRCLQLELLNAHVAGFWGIYNFCGSPPILAALCLLAMLGLLSHFNDNFWRLRYFWSSDIDLWMLNLDQTFSNRFLSADGRGKKSLNV